MDTLSVSQAAQRSGLSSATIKRKITSGELKATQNSQGWHQIAPDDLKSFLATAQLSKTQTVQTALKRARAGAESAPDQLSPYLERELIEARARIKELESELREAHSEIRKLEAEMRGYLSGGVAQSLSRWLKGR